MIEGWVNGAEIEVLIPTSLGGQWVATDAPIFLYDRSYRLKSVEDNMEQYSKAFWGAVLEIPSMHLSDRVSWAINKHGAKIKEWVAGVGQVEVYGDSGWVPVPESHHLFNHKNKYRIAPNGPVEVDVVVYWRDELVVGDRHYVSPPCIDVARLPVEPTHPAQATLASLQAKTPGFKLLSTTRVVVDATDHNLLEYTTTLDNLGRVPF